MVYQAFALSGRLADCYYTQGDCPGLGASALSGRVGQKYSPGRLSGDFLLNKQIVHCNLFLYDVAMFVLLQSERSNQCEEKRFGSLRLFCEDTQFL